jgi:hypothetical protein
VDARFFREKKFIPNKPEQTRTKPNRLIPKRCGLRTVVDSGCGDFFKFHAAIIAKGVGHPQSYPPKNLKIFRSVAGQGDFDNSHRGLVLENWKFGIENCRRVVKLRMLYSACQKNTATVHLNMYFSEEIGGQKELHVELCQGCAEEKGVFSGKQTVDLAEWEKIASKPGCDRGE